MESIVATGNNIVFQFVDDTSAGKFRDVSDGGIIIKGAVTDQHKPRWGKIISVGDSVQVDVKTGQYVLIEGLRWTTHGEFNGQKYWKTDENQLILVSDELVASY